ncbi:MAG: hypothetical protein MI923_02520 [Phycisphaerales bacterium]|nr:hypothetical protein [Phycisphaerales bacterium]
MAELPPSRVKPAMRLSRHLLGVANEVPLTRIVSSNTGLGQAPIEHNSGIHNHLECLAIHSEVLKSIPGAG